MLHITLHIQHFKINGRLSVAILELLGSTPADGTLYTAAKGYLCLIVSGAPLFLLKYVLNDFLRSDDNRRLATRGSLYLSLIHIFLMLFMP